MDDVIKHWMVYRQKKYGSLYKGNYSGTGMFVMSKRKKLLGVTPKTEAETENMKRKAIASFNYDVRENVKLGLVDLELFIESSEKKEVDSTVTTEVLTQILEVLLSREQASNEKLKIAQLLVQAGLRYYKDQVLLTEIQERLFKDTIETSKQLAFLILPKEEKDDISWYTKPW
jgi:hypothetical protein